MLSEYIKGLSAELMITEPACKELSHDLALSFIENICESTKMLLPEELEEWYGPILQHIDYNAETVSDDTHLRLIEFVGAGGWSEWLLDMTDMRDVPRTGKRIVLIACSSQKKDYASPAGELYTSTLFKHSLNWAYTLKPDHILILSAKYGAISLSERVNPYNKTLNKMKIKDRKAWADMVIAQLDPVCDLAKDQFTILAGVKYREHLTPHMSNTRVPLEGLSIGYQLQRLKKPPSFLDSIWHPEA